jgi:hypothetical protein
MTATRRTEVPMCGFGLVQVTFPRGVYLRSLEHLGGWLRGRIVDGEQLTCCMATGVTVAGLGILEVGFPERPDIEALPVEF